MEKTDEEIIIEVIKDCKAKGIKQIDMIDVLNMTWMDLSRIYKVMEKLEKEGKLVVEAEECKVKLK